MNNLSWWPWSPSKKEPLSPTDASYNPLVRSEFTLMLDYTEPPQVFKSSDVAARIPEKELKAMGYENYKDLIPAIKVLAWDMREFGDCVILYTDGKVVPDDVSWMECERPVRFRRKGKIHSDEYDWDD